MKTLPTIPRFAAHRVKMTHNEVEPLPIPEDCLPPAFAAWDTPYQHIGVSSTAKVEMTSALILAPAPRRR
jgi:hypothetical protein